MALKITGGNGDRAPLGTGSQPCPLQPGNGATLTLSLEAALRHDGGDAETGFGLDLGGGIACWPMPTVGASEKWGPFVTPLIDTRKM